MNLNDVLENRGRLVNQMQSILDKAEAENRDLSTEEKSQYEQIEAEQEQLRVRADRLQQFNTLSAGLDHVQATGGNISLDTEGDKDGVASAAYRQAFDAYARRGKATLDDPRILGALQIGTDSEGGYIVPEEFDAMLVEGLQDINDFRNYVSVVTTGGDRNIPIENTLGTATWTAEEAAYTESDAAFGRVILGAHKLGTIIKVSEELLQDSLFDLQSYLAGNFAKRFGLAEEAAIVSGDGSGKPTGLTAGASAGVTAAGAAAITSDEVIDMYHALGRPYRGGARWVMKDSTVKLVRKLKDADNQYLWQPGLQAGQPDMLLGRELVTSDGMPAATTGNISVLFGDLSYYTLAERSGRVFQRLNELYAANGQVGFRMFERLDGALTLSAAVVKLTQA